MSNNANKIPALFFKPKRSPQRNLPLAMAHFIRRIALLITAAGLLTTGMMPVAAPPAPKAVTILEPSEGQVFQTINSLAILFTSTGAVYRIAITGPATADTLVLRDTSRSFPVPSLHFSGSSGAYTLTVTPYTLLGEAGPSAEVHFSIAPEQGVAEETQWEGFSIFPNPAGGASTIQFSLASPEFCSLTIFDAVGREVAKPIPGVIESAGIHDVPFDTRKLASGIYTVRLAAGGSVRVAKVVVR